MKVLFITANRLGDAVLSTGLLNHIIRAYPGARITIACGALPSSLFEGMPGLTRIIVLQKRPFNAHWLDLWKQVAGTKWDMVVDLRDSAVSRLIRSGKKYIYSYSRHIDKNLHKVEQNAAVMNLEKPPAPQLWFSDEQKEKARALIPDGDPVLGIGPTANWPGKMWPAENFIKLIEALTATAPAGILPGARVAVFSASGEESVARKVRDSVPAGRQLDIIAKGDPGTAAAALARCALYIGNDSGLTHCAAAAGTPTLALFGPGWPALYRPWGVHAGYIQTPENCDELTDYEGYCPAKVTDSLMRSLSVEMVKEVTREFWEKQTTAPSASPAAAASCNAV